MSTETVHISKDEYIDLLRSKSELMKIELAKKSTKSPQAKPHSWMGQAEEKEVLRLAANGLRIVEISKLIGRPRSTIHRCLKKHRLIAAQGT
ncbi:helix-turn-helix domain-containing protein [Azonexus sp.]|uniref:helix-turn-helix domain-containing protein n=1 Tax=Azonexus sp. TaxID=1872668 RepID=UPI0035B4716B